MTVDNQPCLLHRLVLCSLPLLVSALMATTANAQTRQSYSGDSYPWLRAVGKLQVPGSRYHNGRRSHYVEDCSATLIAPAHSSSADIIVTAWHCLEFYSDLSKPITFTLLDDSGGLVTRQAHRLADGGSMSADWALLRLLAAVPSPQVAALDIHPGQANPDISIIMAGYSKDVLPDPHGKNLSFDPACTITQQAPEFSDTNCSANQGASGGPVIQLGAEGEPFLCGVISQGNGVGRSTFIPVSRFRATANLYLK
jgi:hypothetical protein